MFSINTNISADIAANNLSKISDQLNRVSAQLSTGKLSVDAGTAESGASLVLGSDAVALKVVSRTLQNGIDYTNTQSSALTSLQDILNSMRTLALESADPTISDNQRDHNQTQFDTLTKALDSIAQSSFNGVALFGSNSSLNFVTDPTGSISLPSGTGSTGVLGVNVFGTASVSVGSSDLNLSGSVGTASAAIDVSNNIVDALNLLAGVSSTLKANYEYLSSTKDTKDAVQISTKKAHSTRADTDFAEASADLARLKVLSAAANAMLVQANQTPQQALQLLRG